MLLLADSVDEFSTICMKSRKHEVVPNTRCDIKPQLLVTEDSNYELDRANNVSAPQLSWDAILKQTRVKLKLTTEPEMYRLLANSMRGCICMITARYTKSNNKYMGTIIDPTKHSIYISNLDANNLYRKAMSYPMRQSGFTLLTEEQWQKINWLAQSADQSTGYFL